MMAEWFWITTKLSFDWYKDEARFARHHAFFSDVIHADENSLLVLMVLQ